MWSCKYVSWSIFLTISVLLSGCAEEEKPLKTFNNYNPSTDMILNPYFADLSEEAPTRFPDLWNRKTVKSLGINRITLYTFGGKSPGDTLEKRIFQFSEQGKHLAYTDYKLDETKAIWSRGTLNWDKSGKNLKIDFNRHFGINKRTSTHLTQTKTGYLILKRKTLNRFDSTFVTGTLEQPKIVVAKIGKNIYSIDVFMPIGTSTADIKAVFNTLKYSEDEMLFAQKNIVFTENNRPTNAFLLNDEYSQITQIKLWEYDDNSNLSLYEEYIGNAVVRSITWTYRTDLLPKTITIDRKQYFYAYD